MILRGILRKGRISMLYGRFFRAAAALAFGLVTAVALGAAAQAHEFKLADLQIGHPWAPESVGPAPTGVVYFSVANGGTTPDRLLSAATPSAKEAQLHTNIVEDGVVKMRPLKGVDVDPGAPVAFQPGGMHVMLIGLKGPLKAGASFPLTLTFEKAGAVEVQVIVQPRAAEAAPMDHMNMMNHMGH